MNPYPANRLKKQIAKLSVAAGFALTAAVATSLLYGNRDYLFEWDFAKTHGKFEKSVPPELVTATRDLAESKEHGEACVVSPVGRDDRYLFVELGCGRFQGEPRNVRNEGEQRLTPVRVRYSGNSVSTIERPNLDAFENSLRRLYPKEAFEKLRLEAMAPSDYLSAGLARTKAKLARTP